MIARDEFFLYAVTEHPKMVDHSECNPTMESVEPSHIGRMGRRVVHSEQHVPTQKVECETAVTKRVGSVYNVVLPVLDELHGAPYGFKILG